MFLKVLGIRSRALGLILEPLGRQQQFRGGALRSSPPHSPEGTDVNYTSAYIVFLLLNVGMVAVAAALVCFLEAKASVCVCARGNE